MEKRSGQEINIITSNMSLCPKFTVLYMALTSNLIAISYISPVVFSVNEYGSEFPFAKLMIYEPSAANTRVLVINCVFQHHSTGFWDAVNIFSSSETRYCSTLLRMAKEYPLCLRPDLLRWSRIKSKRLKRIRPNFFGLFSHSVRFNDPSSYLWRVAAAMTPKHPFGVTAIASPPLLFLLLVSIRRASFVVRFCTLMACSCCLFYMHKNICRTEILTFCK